MKKILKLFAFAILAGCSPVDFNPPKENLDLVQLSTYLNSQNTFHDLVSLNSQNYLASISLSDDQKTRITSLLPLLNLSLSDPKRIDAISKIDQISGIKNTLPLLDKVLDNLEARFVFSKQDFFLILKNNIVDLTSDFSGSFTGRSQLQLPGLAEIEQDIDNLLKCETTCAGQAFGHDPSRGAAYLNFASGCKQGCLNYHRQMN